MIGSVRKVFPYLLLAPAFLPFIYIEGLLYPYVAPKTLLFRALFIIASAAFAYLALSGHTLYFNRLKQWVTWIPGALLIVAYATSLVGLDFYHSFWSVFDRGDGLLTLTSAVGFFYIILLYSDQDFLRRLLSIAAWVGTAVAVYAFFQWLQSVSPMDFPIIAEARGRIGATIGNAAFLSAYLGMTFFATLAVVKEYKGKWRRLLYAGAGFQVLAIMLSATRGTMLALFLAGVLTAVYLSIKGDSSTLLGASGRTQKYARIGLAAAIILAGLFFVFRAPLSEAPFEPIRRIASISVEDVTVSSRLFVWGNVIGKAMEKPFTGYGAEHIDVLFNSVYDPSAIVEEWFDRSHNSYLDYFVQYGAFGAALYFALILTLLLSGWRLMKRDNKYGAFLFLMTVVYAAQNFFIFDTAMTLWLLLAVFAAVLARLYSDDVSTTPLPFSLPRAVPAIVGVSLLVLLYPVAIQPLRANLSLAQGYIYHVSDVNRAIETMQKGLALNTYADVEYGYQAYVMYTDQQQHLLQGEERVVAYQYALETLTKNYERYSYDARTATYLAHVLDLAPPGVAVDEDFKREVLARAVELSPKHAQAQYILANISLKKGDVLQGAERNRYYREAMQMIEEYAAEVPNSAEPRYIIANLYLVMGEKDIAQQWAKEGRAVYKEHVGTARHAAKYYINIEDWSEALFFTKHFSDETMDDYPKNPAEAYDLAKLYFLNDEKEHAKQMVEMLRRESPGLVETDPEFMKALDEYSKGQPL